MKKYKKPKMKLVGINQQSICAGSDKIELSNDKGDNTEAVMSKHNAIFDIE